MTAKLNMKSLGKLEQGGIYIVKFSRPLRKEEQDAMVHQFNMVTEKTKAQFIMFNNEMELLDPKNCKDILIEVLHEWETNKLRIVP